MQLVGNFVLVVILNIKLIIALHVEHFDLLGTIPSDSLMEQRACEIMTTVKANANFVYTSRIYDNDTLQLEAKLHKCVSQLPKYMVRLDDLRLEPLRYRSSLSIFILPGSSAAAQARLTQLTVLLNKHQRCKHIHKYLFIWRNASMPELTQLFELIWSKQILKAIALTDSNHVYTFEPFTASGFEVKLLQSERYFYDKLKNMHHHQLKISMFSDIFSAIPKSDPRDGYTALDGYVASNIVSKLNATALYVPPTDKDNYGRCLNGNFTGVLSSVIPGHTDIGFNMRFVLKCMRPHLEETYPYYRRIVLLVVRAAKKLPYYLLFIDAFQDILWYLLLATMLFCIVLYYLMQCFAQRITRYEQWQHCDWLHTVQMFVRTQFGDPILRFPEISSLRQFLIAWIVYCYVLTTIYFAKLESSFVQPTFEPELDTLDDLPKLQVPIYSVNNMFTVVRDALEPRHWAEIEARAVRIPQNYSAAKWSLLLAKKTKRLAFIQRAEMAKDLVINTYDLEHDEPAFHVVKQQLISLHQLYIVPLGSPYLHKIEHLVSALFESGLLGYWRDKSVRYRIPDSNDEAEFDIDMDTDGDPDPSDDDDAVVLSLDILQGAFYLWAIGIVASVVMFCLELIYWIWWRCIMAQS